MHLHSSATTEFYHLYPLIWLLLFLAGNFAQVSTFQPHFAEPIINITVPVGRDASFTCVVNHLGGYRVGWVKADTKAIQAIHDLVVTHNPRVSVTHNDNSIWNLHIKGVKEEDRGLYMCQINTDPMISQVGHLEVVVPPDIINEESSTDVMVPEGSTVKLTCRARGHPLPHIVWRREDNKNITIKSAGGSKTQVPVYEGQLLKLPKISRTDMGAYFCIASNGVPPSVSKRIMVNVHFHPVIHVPNQLVGAPTSTDVLLECYVEASPRSINYWMRDSGEMIISSDKYEVKETTKSMFEVKMTLVIKTLLKTDVGSYRCIAKNSLGDVESNIRLYEIKLPTKVTMTTREETSLYDDEDYLEQAGSAEKFEERTNTVQRGESSLQQVTNKIEQQNTAATSGQVGNHNKQRGNSKSNGNNGAVVLSENQIPHPPTDISGTTRITWSIEIFGLVCLHFITKYFSYILFFIDFRKT